MHAIEASYNELRERTNPFSEEKQISSILSNISSWIDSELTYKPFYFKTTASVKKLEYLINGRIFTNYEGRDCRLRLDKIQDTQVIRVCIDTYLDYS